MFFDSQKFKFESVNATAGPGGVYKESQQRAVFGRGK